LISEPSFLIICMRTSPQASMDGKQPTTGKQRAFRACSVKGFLCHV
jgi:hypothetical protein